MRQIAGLLLRRLIRGVGRLVIEVELRSLISKEQFQNLHSFFNKNARFKSDDEQVTYYFESEHDIRIQQNKTHSKIVLKKGRLHDDAREEIEINCPRDDFSRLEQLFVSLGYAVQIKWFRKRETFDWDGITVTLDDTKGFGCVIELELASDEKGKSAAIEVLKARFKQLQIEPSKKELFDEKFAFYKKNWKQLV